MINACDDCGNAIEECTCGESPNILEGIAEPTGKALPEQYTAPYRSMFEQAHFPAINIVAPKKAVEAFRTEYNALLERHGFQPEGARTSPKRP